MVAGTASVDGSGNIVGSGTTYNVAVALSAALEAQALADLASAGLEGVNTSSLPAGSVTKIRQSACTLAVIAHQLVLDIQANAKAHVTTQVLASSGGTALDPPLAPVDIPIT
jgi:hypothetical protein